MFAYIWCCPVILLAVLDISAAINSSEKIADVIKNISRVNNVLQELIQNYEHLQNIYKSQEIIEVTEDITFREKNVSNTKRNSFAVTTMYVSDEDGTSEGPSEETKEDKDETTPRATINTTTTERLLSSKNGRAQVIFIDTRLKILKKKENRTQVRNATKKTRFSVQKSGQERGETNKLKYELLPYTGDDINKFTKTPTRLLSNKRIHNELRSSAVTYKNTFNRIEINIARTTAMSTVTRKAKTKNSQGIMFILGDQYSNSSKVTNNVKFYDISNKTLPVAHNQRSNNTHIILKMDSESDSDEESGDQENEDESKDSSDEELLAKDIARTTILGKEYGDACLKLVVRKCYKVCKAVYKAMCSTKCKDEFEDDFDKFSRTGCIQAFVPKEAVQVLTRICTGQTNCTGISYDGSSSHDEFSSETESTTKEKTKKSKKTNKIKQTKKPKKKKKSKKKEACKSALKAVCRLDHCKSELKVVFNKNYKLYCDTLFAEVAQRTANQINENTHGYLTAVCQMPRPNAQNITLKTEPVTNLTEYERNLNNLRTRYEKACIKTSREKCKDACTYAYTKACESNKCKKKKLENFSKQCVRRCKIAFKLEGQKKGSSSSESSDSDDDSDDDSDE